jgi:hypothetical protein
MKIWSHISLALSFFLSPLLIFFSALETCTQIAQTHTQRNFEIDLFRNLLSLFAPFLPPSLSPTKICNFKL